MIAGAHGTLGTALLVWAVALFVEWRRDGASKWPWVLTGSVLGLCRPFDFAAFLLVAGAVSALACLRGRRDSSWAEIVWLAPVLFYDGLAYGLHPSFASWSGSQNTVVLPGFAALAWALGPVFALSILALARGGMDPTLRTTLIAWITVGAVFLFSGLGFASQFATSLGTVLLLAVALGARSRFLPALALALSPTAWVLYWRILNPAPESFPPQDYLTAARLLAARCVSGDVAYAPSEPSLFVAAWSPCQTAFGHRVLTPDFERRAAESEVFFAEATPASWRGRYLGELGARFVMIPAGRGHWLDPAEFAPRWRFPSFEVWERLPPGVGGSGGRGAGLPRGLP
jgi:hypothetical protein